MNNNYIKRAETLIELKRYEEAKEQLYQALGSNPNDFFTLELIARCYYYQKNLSKAIEFAKLSVGSAPYFSGGYLIMAESYRMQKRYKEAEEIALEGLKNDIFTNAGLYFTLGCCAYDQNQFQKGLEYVNIGLQKDAQEEDLLRLRALLLVNLKDLSNAKVTADILLSVAPGNSQSFVTQGKIALLQGYYNKAMDFFVEALRLEPTNKEALSWLHEAAKRTFWFYRFEKWVKRNTFHRFGAFNRFYFGSFATKLMYLFFLRILGSFLAILSIFYFLLTWISNTLSTIHLRFHPTIKHTLTPTIVRNANISLALFVIIAVLFLYFSFK